MRRQAIDRVPMNFGGIAAIKFNILSLAQLRFTQARFRTVQRAQLIAHSRTVVSALLAVNYEMSSPATCYLTEKKLRRQDYGHRWYRSARGRPQEARVSHNPLTQ